MPAESASSGPFGGPIRVAFVLPGLHRVQRGAEIAFESVAQELGRMSDFAVTLIGSGQERADANYRFVHCPCVPRERFEGWFRFPPFRDECVWEEATFVARLLSRYDPRDFDVNVTCSYPFVNWLLRLRRHHKSPQHVFVTQNGDWPVQARNSEFRAFGCDGLVCINPVYFERHKSRTKIWLIPNGVHPERFHQAAPDRTSLGLREDARVVLIVSALIPSKRVLEGIRAISEMPDVHLVVAGNGPLRDEVDAQGRRLMGPRFQRVEVPFDRIPVLYASADALLHMSLNEPFGNVYVEALASGLPVVTHDWESTRWLFEGHGFLVDTTDPAAVRQGVEQALAHRSPEDAAGRRALADRRFTWRAVAEEYAKCFRTLVH